jgi:hypothetical protein
MTAVSPTGIGSPTFTSLSDAPVESDVPAAISTQQATPRRETATNTAAAVHVASYNACPPSEVITSSDVVQSQLATAPVAKAPVYIVASRHATIRPFIAVDTPAAVDAQPSPVSAVATAPAVHAALSRHTPPQPEMAVNASGLLSAVVPVDITPMPVTEVVVDVAKTSVEIATARLATIMASVPC